jgi:hypothetical protein
MTFGTALGSVSLGAAFTLLCQQYAPSPLCRLGGSCIEHVGSALLKQSSSDVCVGESDPEGWLQGIVHDWTHASQGNFPWLILLGLFFVLVVYELVRALVVRLLCSRDGVQVKRRARRSVFG